MTLQSMSQLERMVRYWRSESNSCRYELCPAEIISREKVPFVRLSARLLWELDYRR